MALSLILGCIWVFAATLTAFLPRRRQHVPGLVLLVLAPLMLGYVAWQNGPWVGLAALAGFASMFRSPLVYLFRRARGIQHQRPEARSEVQ